MRVIHLERGPAPHERRSAAESSAVPRRGALHLPGDHRAVLLNPHSAFPNHLSRESVRVSVHARQREVKPTYAGVHALQQAWRRVQGNSLGVRAVHKETGVRNSSD